MASGWLSTHYELWFFDATNRWWRHCATQRVCDCTIRITSVPAPLTCMMHAWAMSGDPQQAGAKRSARAPVPRRVNRLSHIRTSSASTSKKQRPSLLLLSGLVPGSQAPSSHGPCYSPTFSTVLVDLPAIAQTPNHRITTSPNTPKTYQRLAFAQQSPFPPSLPHRLWMQRSTPWQSQ